MASAQVVITRANGDTPTIGGIFEGLSFFLVQRLPSRNSFVHKIQSNGGHVVKLEAQADHIIADHLRKDSPAGSISYTFIDNAIRDGELPDPDNHLAGAPKGAVRDVGSVIPGKSTRTPFTAEDDRVLWQWVETCKSKSAFVKGNEIYKQLEAQNPRHTFQAWRDRYVKKLIDKPPAGVEITVAANPPPSPPTAQDEQPEMSSEAPIQARNARSPRKKREAERAQNDGAADLDPDPQKPEPEPQEPEPQEPEPEQGFTQVDFDELISHARDIECVQESRVEEAWLSWAEALYPPHPAESWRRFWEENVRPVYLKRQETAANEGSSGVKERRSSAPSILGSYSSSKRKRETPTPRANRTYGQKKQRKSNERGIFDQDDTDEELPQQQQHQAKAELSEKFSTQPIEILSDDEGEERADANQNIPTPERNAAAQIQLDQDQERAAAQAQFEEEVLGMPANGALMNDASTSNLPTSEVNHAAGEQLRRESIEAQANADEVDEGGEASQMPMPTFLSPEANNAGQSMIADVPLHEPMEAGGTALTEANLTSQQAQNKTQPSRGTDLHEDNEMQDQSAYIRFLQGVVPGSGALMRQAKAVDVDLQSNEARLGGDDLQPEPNAELPLSSQREVDEALEDAIQWPSPPERSWRRDVLPESTPRPQGQSLQFETQIAYPDLPSQTTGVPQQKAERTFAMNRPSPPDIEEIMDHVLQTDGLYNPEQITPYEFDFFDQETRYELDKEVDSRDASSIGDADADADDVDLVVPQPEGGWDFWSSPVKATMSQQSPSKRELQPEASMRKEGPAEDEEDNDEDEDGDYHDYNEEEGEGESIVVDQEVIEMSPSLSASSSSTSDEEPEGEQLSPRTLWRGDHLKPESDWNSTIVPLPSDFDDESETSEPAPPRPLETQDILNAETQQPDFTVPPPPPPESSDDLPSNPLEAPHSFQASQRNIVESQKLPDDDVDSYINTMIVRGYRESSIVKALYCTSMRPDLAELVLLEEKAGKGFPRDVAGVWGEEEDGRLEAGDAGEIRRLEAKHSWRECEERMGFLGEWREDGE